MSETDTSAAEPHPNGRIAAPALRATLTPTREPKGASMQVEALFEDSPPRHVDGTLVNVRATEIWDHSDDFDLHHLDDPPVCDRGPNLCKGDV
jgi:hypothetical protein